jgi:hypothetical protein
MVSNMALPGSPAFSRSRLSDLLELEGQRVKITAHGSPPWAVGRLRQDRRAERYALICFRAEAWPSRWISIFLGAASWGAGIRISSCRWRTWHRPGPRPPRRGWRRTARRSRTRTPAGNSCPPRHHGWSCGIRRWSGPGLSRRRRHPWDRRRAGRTDAEGAVLAIALYRRPPGRRAIARVRS